MNLKNARNDSKWTHGYYNNNSASIAESYVPNNDDKCGEKNYDAVENEGGKDDNKRLYTKWTKEAVIDRDYRTHNVAVAFVIKRFSPPSGPHTI